MIKSFFIGFFVIALFVVAGLFVLPYGIENWGVGITVAIFTGSLIVLIILFTKFFLGSIKKRMTGQNIPNGISTTAVITNFQQSGTNVSIGTLMYFEMLIDVNVNGADGTQFPARIKQMLPLANLGAFQAGAIIRVKYDPTDKSKVILDTHQNSNAQNFGSTNFNSQNPNQDIMMQVQANQAMFEELNSRGVLSKAKILEVSTIGENIMPNVDFLKVKVHVMPDRHDPYESTIKIPVPKSSQFKCVPGKTMYVKYDPENIHRVVPSGFDTPDSTQKMNV